MQALQARLRQQLQRIPFQRIAALSLHPRFALVVAGLIASLASIMFINFFLLEWYGIADVSRSGIEVTLGIGDGPFGRIADLLLIIVPIATITQITLAVMVFRGVLPLNHALVSMSVVAFLLLIVPMVWQALSTNAFEDTAREFLRGGYSTALHFWLSLFMVLGSVVAGSMYFGHQLGVFPEDPAPPELAAPKATDAGETAAPTETDGGESS